MKYIIGTVTNKLKYNIKLISSRKLLVNKKYPILKYKKIIMYIKDRRQEISLYDNVVINCKTKYNFIIKLLH